MMVPDSVYVSANSSVAINILSPSHWINVNKFRSRDTDFIDTFIIIDNTIIDIHALKLNLK